MGLERFEVYLCNLDPTIGSEIRKTRPCVVISPDEMNRQLRTVVVAPMTGAIRSYPSRVACRFADRDGSIALDQIRTVDHRRIIRKLGVLSEDEANEVLNRLAEMFAR